MPRPYQTLEMAQLEGIFASNLIDPAGIIHEAA